MLAFTTRDNNNNNTNRGANGGHHVGGLFADAAGDFSGASAPGGANGDGTVFDIPSFDGSDAGTPTGFDGANGAYLRADRRRRRGRLRHGKRQLCQRGPRYGGGHRHG